MSLGITEGSASGKPLMFDAGDTEPPFRMLSQPLG